MALWIPRPDLESHLLSQLERQPFLVLAGRRGSGKSTLLEEVAERWRGPSSAVVRMEPIGCTPEVLRGALGAAAGSVIPGLRANGDPFEAMARALRKRPPGSLLLLDDLTELRALSYYPDVTRPLETIVEALAKSKAACIATTRFGFWTAKQFPELPMETVPPLSREELDGAGVREPDTVAAVSGGLPVYARHLVGGELEETLIEGLVPGGIIDAECRAGFSDLLHRARGYGACKSVLRVLSQEEGLTLTEVSRKLDRTPGSTRDYLRWLEEVDLIEARSKRFFYQDPILRLWMRLHAPGVPVPESRLEDEVGLYVEECRGEPAEAASIVFPTAPKEDLVEID